FALLTLDDPGHKNPPTLPKKSSSTSDLGKPEQQRFTTYSGAPVTVPLKELLVPSKDRPKTATFSASADIAMASGVRQPKPVKPKAVASKQQRQKDEQQKAEEPFPPLPKVEESLLPPEVVPTPTTCRVARLVETAQTIILDSTRPNYGLPETVNPIGLDQLKLPAFTWFPSIMKMGHGYHLTTNPALVFGWSESSAAPIFAGEWENQFVSQGGQKPLRRDWRFVAKQTQQINCNNDGILRQIAQQKKEVSDFIGPEGLENRINLTKKAFAWLTALFYYNELMLNRNKTVTHIKSQAVACLECFQQFQKARQLTWDEIPGDCWKWGICKTRSLDLPSEGDLEDMDLATWHRMPQSNEEIDGNHLPNRLKPKWIQHYET
ncbi:MAG: hypothetical protein GY740_22095, partial [Gammaproteobacteria bacterium]|nr:hypothetical protein [Gammaproteobacteria bacterium]